MSILVRFKSRTCSGFSSVSGTIIIIVFFLSASKFRCHISSKSLKDNHQVLRGKLSKCQISKSACELQNHGGGHKSSVEEPAQIEKENKVTAPHPQHDILARHATVVQRTQAFFSSLKVRRRGNLIGLLYCILYFVDQIRRVA